MPGYATAVADLLRQRRDSGLEDVPLNVLIIGRAVDAALPGRLTARNGNFYIDSARIESPADLYGTIRIPGVRFKHMLMVGDSTGRVDVNDPPAALLVPFGIGSIAGLVGAVNVDFMGALAKTWKDRIAPSGLLPAASVNAAVALISIGIIVIPETADRLAQDFPRLASDLLQIPNCTPERRSAWYQIAERMRADLSAYFKSQVDVAAAAVAAAERDTAFWDGVYKTVEAVRDAPATAAGAVLDAAGSAAKSAAGVFLRGPFFIIAALAAAGGLLWWFWPRLASAAVKAAKDARGT